MKDTQVLFLAFGNRNDLCAQIYLSIRTIQKFKYKNIIFNVLTDQPDLFRALDGDVIVHELSNSKIKKWRGLHDFLFRVKLKAIEYIAKLNPESNLLFLDSDTTMEDDPIQIINLLNSGKSVMHLKEKVLSLSKDRADKNLVRILSDFRYNDLEFTERTSMYNSGVIGLPAAQSVSLIRKSIEVCDAICSTPANRAFVEQLAVGIVLEKYSELTTVENTVLHYWGNKDEWNNFIRDFLVTSKLRNFTKEQEIEWLKSKKLSTIPIRSRAQINNQRLKRLADKFFSKKRQTFFEY